MNTRPAGFVLATLLVVLLAPAARPESGEPPAIQPGFRAVAFSPDGKLLAAGSGEGKEPGMLIVWHIATAKKRFTHREPAGVASVAFSPDGETLAIAVFNQPAKLIDAQTGRARATLQGHEKPIRSVAFSPDGKSLATASYDWTIKVWELPALRERRTLRGHSERVFAAVFSSDGKRLVSVSADRTARLWDLATGEGRILGPHGSLVGAALFSPDSRWVLTGSWDGMARLWDVAKEGPRCRWQIMMSTVDALAFSPHLRVLAVGGVNKIELFDLHLEEPTRKERERIRSLLTRLDEDSYSTRENASRELREMGFVAEAELRKVARESPSVEVRIRARRIRAALLSKPRAVLSGHRDEVQALAFSPDGRRLASAGVDGTVRLWDVANRTEVSRFTAR